MLDRLLVNKASAGVRLDVILHQKNFSRNSEPYKVKIRSRCSISIDRLSLSLLPQDGVSQLARQLKQLLEHAWSSLSHLSALPDGWSGSGMERKEVWTGDDKAQDR